MSDTTTETETEVDDWPEVWQRARAKARRMGGAGASPLVDTEASRERRAAEADSDLQDLIGRFMARTERLPKDLPPTPAAPPRSAIEVRLGWYIPPRHTADTLESFQPLTDSQAEALQATRDFVASVLAGEGGALALIGGVGTGKSHLLYAAVRALNEAGIHAAAGGWYDLADTLRQAKYGHEEDVTQARIHKSRILGAAALGIDEIRPTSGTDYDTTELSQLMTRAYRERQGVIVTSNYADEKLSRIVGLAASSRLTQVVVEGPDLRQPENRRFLRAI